MYTIYEVLAEIGAQYKENRDRWLRWFNEIDVLVGVVIRDPWLAENGEPHVQLGLWPLPGLRFFDYDTPEYNDEARRLTTETIARLRAGLPGMWVKNDDPSTFSLKYEFPSQHVKVSVSQSRDKVCTITESETETEEVEVVDPDYYEACKALKVAFTKTETRPKRIIECPSILGGAS